MLNCVSSCFNKIKLQFFKAVENARQSNKRIMDDISDDDDTSTSNPYKPLRKKMCPSQDETLPTLTRTSYFKPTLRCKTRTSFSLSTIKEDEPAKAKIKKYKGVRKPATLDTAPSTSTKAIQPMLRTYGGCKNKTENDRKILKFGRNASLKEKSESWPRKVLGGANYSLKNKTPLAVSSTKWRTTTIAESFRIDEKKQYRQLLQQCTLSKSPPRSCSSSVCQISSSSSNSSRSSSYHSVPSDEEKDNSSSTSAITKLLKPPELKIKHKSKEVESSEDDKRHSSHHKPSRTMTPLSDITRNKFINSKVKTNESVNRSVRSCDDAKEECSSRQSVIHRYPQRKKGNSIPVIDLCESDSDSIEAIKDTDEESIEIVDEFPCGSKKTSVLEDLYNRKWMQLLQDEHTSTDEEDDSKYSTERSRAQAFHDKIENRLKHLELICASTNTSKPPSILMKKSLFPPLTPEMQDIIEEALIPYPKSEILIHKFNIKISRRDIDTLNGLNWLNDEVINFYLNLIMHRSMNNKRLPKVYVFSTFFYPKLCQSGHKSVSRWTKKVDIFTYDILLIPIHLDVHWCMTTVDFKNRCITYYDSMLGDNTTCLEILLKYLKAEHMDKKNISYKATGWKLETMKNIPEQMNGSDCGVFSCKFAEYKSRLAPFDFTQEDMPYFRRKMVYEIVKAELLG